LQRVIVKLASTSDTASSAKELDESVRLLLIKGSGARGPAITGMAGLKAAIGTDLTATVYILSHSDGKAVGSMAPRELAAALADHLPSKYSGKIVLVACYSAAAGKWPAYAPLKGGEVTYARLLAHFLAKKQEETTRVDGERVKMRDLAIASVHGRPGVSTLDAVTGARMLYSEEGGSAVTKAHNDWLKANEPGRDQELLAVEQEGRAEEQKATADRAEYERQLAALEAPHTVAELAAVKAAEARAEAATDAKSNARPEDLADAEVAAQKAEEELDVAADALEAKVAELHGTDPRMAELVRLIAEADATLQRIRDSRTAKKHMVRTAFRDRAAMKLAEFQTALGGVKRGREADVGYAVSEKAPKLVPTPRPPAAPVPSVTAAPPPATAAPAPEPATAEPPPIAVETEVVEVPAKGAEQDGS
jgi:hypothetical protein